MSNRCSNCGAELFAGQQFCRTCGKPTQTLSPNEMPTQALPGQAQTAGSPARTSPLSGASTGDFYPPPSGSYPSVYVPAGAAASQAGVPPRKRRSKKLWVGLGLLFVLVCMGGVALLALIADSPRTIVVRKKAVTPPRAPAAPAAPKAEGVSGTTLVEDGAQETDDETVITKTYALATGA
ncbi:MAG TPA: hypothetical protein VF754_05320, partial [Pyrinomonadaceae bacterium]